MIRTFGLTHVALAVKDVHRSLLFYQQVLGVVPVYQQESFVQVQTPGSRDVIVFEEGPGLAAAPGGGIRHFGFRLIDPADIDRAAEAVEQAGGTVIDKGEFCPGEPVCVLSRSRRLRSRDLGHQLPTPVAPAID